MVLFVSMALRSACTLPSLWAAPEPVNALCDRRCDDPSLALSLYRTAPGVLEQYEHLNKVHPASHSQPASAASASAAGEGGPAGGGASSSGGGAAEGQPGGAGASPVADSDILKTDSPGAGETQHPGETSPGVMEPKASGRWGEQQQCCCASAAAAADTQCWLIAA